MTMKPVILVPLVVLAYARLVRGINSDEFYVALHEPVESLSPGNEEFAEIKLDTPVYFYNEKYDHVFVSKNSNNSINNVSGISLSISPGRGDHVVTFKTLIKKFSL